MKKLTMLLATGLSIVALASCGGNKDPEPTPGSEKMVKNVSGGTADEQQAIEDAANKSIVLLSGGSGILPTAVTDLTEDNGDYLKVTTSQAVKVNGAKYTVNFEWKGDESSASFGGYTTLDATHGLFELNYPGKGNPDGTFFIKLNKVTCGGASSTDTGMTYNFNVKAATYFHKDVQIKDLYKLKDIGDGKWGYDIVDYVTNPTNAYFAPNPENAGIADKQYFYINAYGKMIYNSPDGNWGLVADGDDILEVYAGSAYNILPERYPAMTNGYVKVIANMSQYNGNVQAGFITEMKKCDKNKLANPDFEVNYQAMTPEFIDMLVEDDHHKQCVHDETLGDLSLSNSLRSMTGTYVAGSLVDGDGKTTTVDKISSGKRFVFQVNIGTEEEPCNVSVAYDYHTDKAGDIGLYNKIKSFISGGQSKTIKGTLRFCGSDSSPFNQTGGVWQLVPFLADHVA